MKTQLMFMVLLGPGALWGAVTNLVSVTNYGPHSYLRERNGAVVDTREWREIHIEFNEKGARRFDIVSVPTGPRVVNKLERQGGLLGNPSVPAKKKEYRGFVMLLNYGGAQAGTISCKATQSGSTNVHGRKLEVWDCGKPHFTEVIQTRKIVTP